MYVGDMKFGETRIAVDACIGGGHVISAASLIEDMAEADALAAQFAKSLRIRNTGIRWHGSTATPDIPTGTYGWVRFNVQFVDNGVQGKANETGAKRVASYLRKLGDLGITPVWTGNMTEADFRSFLASQV